MAFWEYALKIKAQGTSPALYIGKFLVELMSLEGYQTFLLKVPNKNDYSQHRKFIKTPGDALWLPLTKIPCYDEVSKIYREPFRSGDIYRVKFEKNETGELVITIKERIFNIEEAKRNRSPKLKEFLKSE